MQFFRNIKPLALTLFIALGLFVQSRDTLETADAQILIVATGHHDVVKIIYNPEPTQICKPYRGASGQKARVVDL